MTNPNDSAYPFDGEVEGIPETRVWNMGLTNEFITTTPTKLKVQSRGWTKREIVLKDFMCAIISSRKGESVTPEWMAETLAKEAAILTEAYFNELNKQQ